MWKLATSEFVLLTFHLPSKQVSLVSPSLSLTREQGNWKRNIETHVLSNRVRLLVNCQLGRDVLKMEDVSDLSLLLI